MLLYCLLFFGSVGLLELALAASASFRRSRPCPPPLPPIAPEPPCPLPVSAVLKRADVPLARVGVLILC